MSAGGPLAALTSMTRGKTRSAAYSGHGIGSRFVLERAGIGALLNVEQLRVEGQHLGRERPALRQLSRPRVPLRPHVRAKQQFGHQTFSIWTRKALNSGVRELASPTNGVRLLAIQNFDFSGCMSAGMPT